MQLNAQEVVNQARALLQDRLPLQQGQAFSDDDILRAASITQSELVAEVIESGEDYFLEKREVALADGQIQIPLFDGFLLLRYLETYPPGSDPIEATESRLVEGVSGSGGGYQPTFESAHYYALSADHIEISPPGVAGVTMRGWYIQTPPPLILASPTSVPGGDSVVFPSSSLAPLEDNLLVGCLFDVVSGPGAGQRRKCTAYVGSTRTATFATPFSPTIDPTSVLASISKVPRLFHHLLAYGAAIRCGAIEKEQMEDVKALFNSGFGKLQDFVERARTGGQRASAAFDLDV